MKLKKIISSFGEDLKEKRYSLLNMLLLMFAFASSVFIVLTPYFYGLKLQMGKYSEFISKLTQTLPFTAQIEISGETIELEVAQTQQQQVIGLSNRVFLDSNRGMLFEIQPPRSVRFWMKNCLISLDQDLRMRNEV